jgi:hypothetical protein
MKDMKQSSGQLSVDSSQSSAENSSGSSYFEAVNYEGSWEEDFLHENGNYMNVCRLCNKEFLGNKRRYVCKCCVKTANEDMNYFSNKEAESGNEKKVSINIGAFIKKLLTLNFKL